MQKKVICLMTVLSVIIAFSATSLLQPAARADYSARSSAPDSGNAYYYSSKNPFYASGFEGQCTWYSWGRAYEILGSRPKLSTGNANAWYNYNVSKGYYSYGSEARIGAVACWTGSGYIGHVAVVEAIDSDGTVWVSNCNHNHDKTFHYDRLSSIKVSGGTFQGFIYLLSGGSSPAPTAAPAGLSVSSTENGTYTVTIPANYYLKCYSAPVSTSVSRHISKQSDSYRLVCDQKLALSDGSVRYHFLDADNNSLYFVYSSDMSVSVPAAATPTPTSVKAGTVGKPVVSSSSDNVTVSWSKTSSADRYDVYLVQAPWAWSDIKYVSHVSDDTTSHTFTNVADGDYAAFVIARPNDDTAESEWNYFTVKKIVRHTVHFDATAGTVSISSMTVTNGSAYGTLPTPKRKYWLFDGWHLGSREITASTIVDLDSDVTLIAYWSAGTNSASRFRDVSVMDWYYNGISNAVDNNLFDGTSATTFEPKGTMTRAMFCKVLSRLMGANVNGSVAQFTDVPNGQWYSNYVNWAARKGIVNGVGNGCFDPDGPISEEAVLTVLYRCAGSPVSSGSIGDTISGSTSDWAKSAVIWAQNRGLFYGITAVDSSDPKKPVTYYPNQATSRAHVACILMNYMRT